ncbi:MAG: Gfo/Idh/MocA family oxidoreductase [Proteobacteria bacterium]|nr:Gfo/Idh/MocA family oxidoreductase [Pseudomonadota bacterium]
MKRFAQIGAAGYIAPRHMEAIRATGNDLVAALDPNDSVGVIDSYFPEARFFTEFERFDRHIDLLRREGRGVDYIAITSPNYLHDSHIRFSLRSGAHAICEKPLVLNPWNIDALAEVEQDLGRRVYTVLQLRLHPSIIELRQKVASILKSSADHIFDVDLTYLTSRGRWYLVSWKGNIAKSGGIATNIGVHFFDMLGWIFGPLQDQRVHLSADTLGSGMLQFEHARVRWFLSTDFEYIPEKIKKTGQRTYRSITVDGEEVEFSGGFTDLHTLSYEDILAGGGFGLEDARRSIEIVHDIRVSEVCSPDRDAHPFARAISR